MINRRLAHATKRLAFGNGQGTPAASSVTVKNIHAGEMQAFTQAFYDARELAMARMQYEAREMGGPAGLVGVDVVEGSHGWGSHVVEFAAVGTAVLPITGLPLG